MKVFHVTNLTAAQKILEMGFKDYGCSWLSHGLEEMLDGVWFSDRPLDQSEGTKGSIVLSIDIPEDLFSKYEWVPEDGEVYYRESFIPAKEINRYGPPVVCDDE